MHLPPARRLLTATFAILAVSTLGFGHFVFAPHPAQAAGAAFTIGLWGDVPYAKEGNGQQVPLMISDMNAANLAFTVFDGDTKDGSSTCTDDTIGKQAMDRFSTVSAPTVYVLGDNEWTDCHRTNNGSYNALERLAFLRKTFFAQSDSLGKTTMKLEHQGAPTQAYAENTRWSYQGVMFLTLNIPGSNNGFVNSPDECTPSNTKRPLTDCYADQVEATLRDQANIQWLRDSFALAKSQGAPGVMIVIQADMSFDLPETTADERSDPNFSGYTNFLNALVTETQNFTGQVVLVHGDTHFFKVDKPIAIDPAAKGNRFLFNDNARVLANFTRVQTFGNANVDWVKCVVDPNSATVFTFEPKMIPIAAATPTPTATAALR